MIFLGILITLCCTACWFLGYWQGCAYMTKRAKHHMDELHQHHLATLKKILGER